MEGGGTPDDFEDFIDDEKEPGKGSRDKDPDTPRDKRFGLSKRKQTKD